MKRSDQITITAAPSCLPALFQFAYLQTLDLLTTVAFLMMGAQEGNPLVRAVIGLVSNPVLGLLYVKSVALLLGVYCWRRQKRQLLERVNLFYALVVAWNLLAVIVAAAGLR